MPARVTFVIPIEAFIFYPPKNIFRFLYIATNTEVNPSFSTKSRSDFTPIFQTHAMYTLWGLIKEGLL
jgi:hypothetical protein